MLPASRFPVGNAYADRGNAALSPVLDLMRISRVMSTISFYPHNNQMR